MTSTDLERGAAWLLEHVQRGGTGDEYLAVSASWLLVRKLVLPALVEREIATPLRTFSRSQMMICYGEDGPALRLCALTDRDHVVGLSFKAAWLYLPGRLPDSSMDSFEWLYHHARLLRAEWLVTGADML